MKTIKNTILMMGISAMAVLSAPVFAADAPAAAGGLTFGIVDMNKVLQTTDAAKDIIAQMEVKRKEYQAQIVKEEDSIRSAGQELVKQKDTLAKAAFEEKYKALDERSSQEQKLVQDRKRILDQAFYGAMKNLRDHAAEIVAAAAKERHYSAVFTQDAVMMSTPDLDLTDIVIDQMNKTVKKIPVDWTSASASSDDSAAGKSRKK
jgi:outer membrane protein